MGIIAQENLNNYLEILLDIGVSELIKQIELFLKL